MDHFHIDPKNYNTLVKLNQILIDYLCQTSGFDKISSSDFEQLVNANQLENAGVLLQSYKDQIDTISPSVLAETIKKLQAEMAERRATEEALRESERKYRELVQCANTIILRVNKDEAITFFNEYAQNFFGFTEDEIIGGDINQIIAPQYQKNTNSGLSSLISQIFEQPEQFSYHENENIKKTGERVWIAWNNRPIYDSTGNLVEMLCIGTDITVRKIGEEALRESERKYRFMFEESPTGCIIIGRDGLMKEINKTFLETLGYSNEELIGNKALDYVVEAQRELVAQRISNYFEGKTCPEMDIQIYCKSKDIKIIRFSGKTALLFDKGHPNSILISGVDVTTRQHMKMLNKQNQERLMQADKMATLGILVSGVAHEINNPNNFILLNSNNLSDLWQDLQYHLDIKLANDGDFTLAGLPYSEIRNDIAPLITGISEGAERIRKIVQSLKDFARKDPGNIDQCIDLNSAVEKSLIILNNLIKKSTRRFSLSYQSKLPLVKGNFQQIEQVIINLVTNACQAITDVNQAISIKTFYLPESQQVAVEVRDQGRGISPEHLKYIFDPFFTTKRDCGGTGLGLSISYNIVKDHHGELKFDSLPGQGTTVLVLLPVSKNQDLSYE